MEWLDRFRGRATTKDSKRLLLRCYARTGNVSLSCRAAGVHRDTWYEWLATDPAFAEAAQEAKLVAIDIIEGQAFQLAMDGNVTMIIFLLRNLWPEKYGVPMQPFKGGSTPQRQPPADGLGEWVDGDYRELSNEEIERMLAELDEPTNPE